MVEKELRGDIEPATQDSETQQDFPETAAVRASLQQFSSDKIGVLVHWGLYAKAGIVESWELSDEDEWARGKSAFRPNMKQLKQDYWGLNSGFDPQNFDPQAWLRLFKHAGIRYLIFTTKHHDGFNLYDTQFSDYKVGGTGSPYHGVEIFGALMTSARQAGLKTGAYYSKADWFHPDYWTKDDHPKSRHADYVPTQQPERWQRYVDFVHAQLRELASRYGGLSILWLDAGWVGAPREDLQLEQIAEEIRLLQPNILIVDRTRGGRFENYVTPERRIPSVDRLPTQVWESGLPLADNWGYVPHDHYKSLKQIILSLLQVISLGGNLLLGVGPKPEGALPKQAIQRLTELGAWTSQNQEGIYGTHAIEPIIFKRATKQEIYLTQDDQSYYLFVTHPARDESNRLKVARYQTCGCSASSWGEGKFRFSH